MTIYELKTNHKRANPDSHFFDPETLKFFGENLSSMKVQKETAKITDYLGREHDCYVLSAYQRKHPCGAQTHYFYFDSTSFEIVYKVED